MTWEEIKANHRDDIKRQAIPFFKSPKGVFEGHPRKLRWQMCVKMVVETWLVLGPQKDSVPTRTFHL